MPMIFLHSETAYREVVLKDFYGIRPLFMSSAKIHYVLDIGANVGIFSVMCRFLFPKAKILAIEPHPETYKALQENCAYLNIQTMNVGLGTGQPTRITNLAYSGCNFSISDEETAKLPPGAVTDPIPTLTFEQLCTAANFESYGTLLKVDCEGGEIHILQDEKLIPKLLEYAHIGMELHKPSSKMRMTRREVLAWVEKFKLAATNRGHVFMAGKRNAIFRYTNKG